MQYQRPEPVLPKREKVGRKQGKLPKSEFDKLTVGRERNSNNRAYDKMLTNEVAEVERRVVELNNELAEFYTGKSEDFGKYFKEHKMTFNKYVGENYSRSYAEELKEHRRKTKKFEKAEAGLNRRAENSKRDPKDDINSKLKDEKIVRRHIREKIVVRDAAGLNEELALAGEVMQEETARFRAGYKDYLEQGIFYNEKQLKVLPLFDDSELEKGKVELKSGEIRGVGKKATVAVNEFYNAPATIKNERRIIAPGSKRAIKVSNLQPVVPEERTVSMVEGVAVKSFVDEKDGLKQNLGEKMTAAGVEFHDNYYGA